MEGILASFATPALQKLLDIASVVAGRATSVHLTNSQRRDKRAERIKDTMKLSLTIFALVIVTTIRSTSGSTGLRELGLGEEPSIVAGVDVPSNTEDPEDLRSLLPELTGVEEEHGRSLAEGNCAIYANRRQANLKAGYCYNLGGTSWNDVVTWMKASDDTCIVAYEHHEGGASSKHCGGGWYSLSSLSKKASRFCCSPQKRGPSINPLTGTCTANGGACGCGRSGDNKQLTMNRFFGDNTDSKVEGCGGAFALSSLGLNQQWGGSLSSTGEAVANVAASIGLKFEQGKSFDGWEGCCYICGANLQIAGKISDGWYCEKDFFSTGIWLKGKNK